MKRSELIAGKTYTNGSTSKWNQERTITSIAEGKAYFDITAGRNQGGQGKMTLAGFAQWAEKEVLVDGSAS